MSKCLSIEAHISMPLKMIIIQHSCLLLKKVTIVNGTVYNINSRVLLFISNWDNHVCRKKNYRILWFACLGYTKVVEILIAKGARINILNKMHFSALDYAYNATEGKEIFITTDYFYTARDRKMWQSEELCYFSGFVSFRNKISTITWLIKLYKIYCYCFFFEGREGVIRLLTQRGAERGGR